MSTGQACLYLGQSMLYGAGSCYILRLGQYAWARLAQHLFGVCRPVVLVSCVFDILGNMVPRYLI